MERVVIVGAGQAGLQVAVSLRERGYSGLVTLLGDEPVAPYQRPPLSKKYMGVGAKFESLLLRPERFFADNRIELRKGVAASMIDRAARQVVASDGERIPYDCLVIATGARTRELPVPGSHLPGVLSLRSSADAEMLREALAGARRVAIIGGGFIGLEISSHCRDLGLETVIIEMMDRVAARAVTPETARRLIEHQRAIGVEVLLGTGVRRVLESDGRAAAVELSDGRTIAADTVLSCIGVRPNEEIAAQAGLSVANGIVVDAQLRTTDPSIFAIGDCARFPCASYGRDMRLESVPNAIEQARHVAGVIMGHERAFEAMPWFWSDQGKLKLQMAGPTQIADDFFTIDHGASGSVFCFKDGLLIGVECINRPVDFVQTRKLLSLNSGLSRSAIEAANFDLGAAMASAVDEIRRRAS